MSKANELKNALVGLFRSGADAEHDADEMEGLLEGIDFPVLAQALYSLREPVYAFFTETNTQQGFDYYGAPLFPQGILLVQDLVEDRGDEFDMFSCIWNSGCCRICGLLSFPASRPAFSGTAESPSIVRSRKKIGKARAWRLTSWTLPTFWRKNAISSGNVSCQCTNCNAERQGGRNGLFPCGKTMKF